MANGEINRRILLTGLFLLSLAGTGMASDQVIQIWKDPSCACCEDWIVHLQKNTGRQVRIINTRNADARARLGVAARFGSCHTASIDGYAIEGHVPASDIQRLLKERPQAVGLAAPGMPIGSPGMDGPAYGGRKMPYDVLLIQADGSSSVYQAYR